MRALTLALVLLFSLPLGSIEAQFDGLLVGTTPRIEISPRFPAPNSIAQATINDYAVDSRGSVVSWRINGTAAPDLQNQRGVSVPIGDVGTPVRIEAIITPTGGSPVAVQQTVTPVYLDLIVEPQTRTPHFYQGRALPSVGSTINITALTNGGTLPREELVYTWRLNNTTLLGGAVRGQNQVSIVMPQGDAVVDVEVERVGRGIIASKSIQLVNTVPFLRFYEVNSLYGMSYRPLSALTMVGNSATVRAEPYYLDSQTFNNPGLAEWTLNNGAAPAGNNPYEITLVRQFTSSALPVNFHVRNLNQVLQGAQGGFSVQ